MKTIQQFKSKLFDSSPQNTQFASGNKQLFPNFAENVGPKIYFNSKNQVYAKKFKSK